MTNYYSLLGLDRSATKADIKKNYRLLATKYHPDKSKDPDSATKFIAITEAYDVLSNKKSRAQYDLFVWEKLKRQKEARDSFATVVPPRESTRTRRNKAQRIRSIAYHQSGETQKLFLLVVESMRIVWRYTLHVLGITLAVFILGSVYSQLSQVFDKGLLPGIFNSLIMLGIVYSIFWMGSVLYSDYKKDMEAFSVFYKISQSKAIAFTMLVFIILLIGYLRFLQIYF